MAVLGLLVSEDLHGYELRKRLSRTLGPIGRLSFGTLYPALNRLEGSGAVEVTKVTESRTGLTTTRGRKVYSITATGRTMFEQMLDSEPAGGDDDRAFALRLAFARHLSGEARMRLLVRRREQLVTRQQDTERALSEYSDVENDYGRMLLEHTNEMTAQDISWIDRLINNEQRTRLGREPEGNQP